MDDCTITNNKIAEELDYSANHGCLLDGAQSIGPDVKVGKAQPDLIDITDEINAAGPTPYFREDPVAHLAEFAKDPFEMILVQQVRRLHEQMDYYFDTAGRTLDPMHRQNFIRFAMELMDKTLKIHDSLRKARSQGKQEVVVKHQEVENPVRRRARARRGDPRESAGALPAATRGVSI